MSAASARGERGFTLVEVLVVMILVAMISSVLFQGLSQAVRIRRNAGVETARVEKDAMRRVWYRQLVNGLVADADDGTARFQGGPASFRGESTNPIDIDTGAVTPVTVALEIDTATESTIVRVTSDSLSGRSQSVPLLTLPGTDFAFAYVDSDGSRSPVWPRRGFDKLPQLPAAIWLVDTSAEHGGELLAASIVGRRETPIGMLEMLKAQQ